jgi:subtilisin family serine protease
VQGAIADFSSFGPRRDGVKKPEIAASGYGMASARSVATTFASTSIVDDGVHVMMTGTSTAAAAAAGAVALLLEEFPGLDPASARTILQTRANRDANTGTALPNARWGWGKLAVGVSTSGVGDPPAPGTERLDVIRLGAPYPNPVHDLTRVPFVLSQADDVKASVYDVQGREVRLLLDSHMEAGDHSLTWNGTDNENRLVASGQYYLVVSSRTARQSRAISLVR